MINVEEKKSLESIQDILVKNSLKKELTNHPVLAKYRSTTLEKDQVATILGQWYYPLSNFPYFLSSLIAHTSSINIQTFISKILYQELGCGDPAMTHLKLYISTMTDVGFDEDAVAKAPMTDATKALLDGYKKSVKNEFTGLGFLYGTEVADLAMVSSIGKAVSNCTGVKKLPWVDIHVQQEPDHVASVNSSLDFFVSEEEEALILNSAEEMWKLWIAFFESIDNSL